MADFSALKTAIQANIRTNGNEEITGAILQDILLSMVTTMGDGAINSLVTALQEEVLARQNAVGGEAEARQQADSALGGRIDGVANSITAINTKLAEGYIYVGIATPSTNPSTPTGKVFYIALQGGTYTNFSGLTVTQGINILKYNGSAWSLEQLWGVDDVPTAGSNNLVKSGGVYEIDEGFRRKFNILFGDGIELGKSVASGGSQIGELMNSSDTQDRIIMQIPSDAKSLIFSGVAIQRIFYYSGVPSHGTFTDYRTYNQTQATMTEFVVPDGAKYIVMVFDKEYNVSYANFVVEIKTNAIDSIITQINSINSEIDVANDQSKTSDNSIYQGKTVLYEKVAVFGGTQAGTISDNAGYDCILFRIPVNSKFIYINGVSPHSIVLYSGYPSKAKYLDTLTSNIYQNILSFNAAATYLAINFTHDAEQTYNGLLVEFTSKMDDSTRCFWTIGDSLCSSNDWQERLCLDKGYTFYSDLNILPEKSISRGGTTTSADEDDGGQQRAINLVSYKDEKPIDIVFIQNYNDRSLQYVGTISDVPFMRSGVYYHPTIPGYTTPSALLDYLTNHLIDAVSDVPSEYQKRGMVVKFIAEGSGTDYNGSKLVLSGSVTNNGTVSITYGGTTYNIPVTSGMTTDEVISKLLDFNYGAGVYDVKIDGNFAIYSPSHPERRITSFNTGSTGLSASIQDYVGPTVYNRFFAGKDSTEWNDSTKWLPYLSLYAQYKGLIQYLQESLPSASLIWLAPACIYADFGNNQYKRADGTWDVDSYKASSVYQSYESLKTIQKTVSEYYGIPFIDLEKLSGITLFNGSVYFYSNNIHPKLAGYQRWADFIAKYI